MNTQELAQKTAELTDRSTAEIQHMLDHMDADQIINLTIAVQEADTDVIEDVLQGVDAHDPELEHLSVPEIRGRIQSMGRKMIKQGDHMHDVWPLIGKLKAEDWKMMWPSVDEEILNSLYKEATNQDVDQIHAADAVRIHDHAISYVAESMVLYENEWWQVLVPQAPDNLVGICQQHHVIWVPRHDLQPLHEHVLGMTQMPSLARMKQLAGVPDTHVVTPQAHVTPLTHMGATEWLSDLRMHMREIEKLHAAPQTPDTQEEMRLHMKAISRKAQAAVSDLT
jgi:hypothetical protein